MTRFLIIIVLLLPFVGSAAEQPVWVESSGEAEQGEHDTLKDTKSRARRDSQLRAVEQAVGAFIRSHTLVSNNQVADDLVYASVRGKARQTDVLSEGWDEKDRSIYRVTVRVLVEPVYPEKGEGMTAKLSLSRDQLREGDEVKVLYQTGADGYVYLFSVAADGSVTLLFPNALHKDNRRPRRHRLRVSAGGKPCQAVSRFPPRFQGRRNGGKGQAYRDQEEGNLIPLGFQEGMFTTYDATSTGLISDLVRKLNQLDPADWAESTAVYRIVR